MATRLVISGRVQMVGYRDWLVARATALGVRGWVRNRADGTVEALLDGPPDAVDTLRAACWRGPRAAEVTEIAVHDADPPEGDGFRRLATA